MLLVCRLLDVFIIAIIARIILSFFPISPNSAMSSVYGVLYSITEPVMGPLRRVIPTIGMFDLSPMIIIFGVRILQAAIC